MFYHRSILSQYAPISPWMRMAGDVEQQAPQKVQQNHAVNWDVTQHHYHRVIAVQVVYLFVSYAGASPVTIAIFSALRVLVLALFFLGSERKSSFHDLEAGDASLGLVMDARALSRALTSLLDGQPWPHHLPTHRATVLRMQRTLAVSYKWHEEERPLTTDGHSINMSDFQIRALLQGIKSASCEFV